MCSSGTVSGGPASALPANSAKRIRSGGVDAWLCRDAQGLYALDNHCTHADRPMIFEGASQGFYCPAHGATFDFNGDHPTSPAPWPLDHFAVCVDSAGNVWIDGNQTVSASTRA